MEEGVVMKKRMKLNILRFSTNVEENIDIKINADLKIEGTNRKLKDIDTAINNIDDRLNEQIYCCVHMEDTQQSFSSGNYALVNLGYVETDTHNGFNTNTHTYTVPKSGYYLIVTQVEFSFDGTRRIVSKIHVNGTAIRYSINGGVGASSAVPLTEIRSLNQGDTVNLYAKVDGVASSIAANNMSTYFQIKKI
jgi:hypothetical protein